MSMHVCMRSRDMLVIHEASELWLHRLLLVAASTCSLYSSTMDALMWRCTPAHCTAWRCTR